MAANFTATLATPGTEKEAVIFSNGGTSTPAVTVIVSTTKCTTQREAAALIRRIADRIEESNFPAA